MTRFILIISMIIFLLNVSAQDSNTIQRDFAIKLLNEKVSNLQQQIEKSEAHLKELQDAKKDEIEKVMQEKEESLNTRMILYSGFFIALLTLSAWLLNWLGKKEIRNIVAEFTKTKVDEELDVKLSKEVIDVKLTEWGEPAIRKMVEELTEAGNKAKQHAVDLEEAKEKYVILIEEMEIIKGNSDVSKTTPEEKRKVKEFNKVTQEVKKEEDFTADDWFWKGVMTRQENDFDTAIKYFTKAINLSSVSNYYINRGFCFDKLNQTEKAILDYNKAIDIDPQNYIAWSNRASSKNNLKNYQEAIIDFDESIRLNPNYARGFNNRGAVKNEIGKYKEAIEDLNEAIKLEPQFASAWNNRGFAKNGLRKYADAIDDLNVAIKLKTDFSYSYRHRAYANFELGNLALALNDINKAIELASDYKEALQLRDEIIKAIN